MMCREKSRFHDDESKLSVLVVEDEVIVRELLCDILESEGYATLPMESADLALHYLGEHSEDVSLLLTDINMPGTINGAGLAKASVVLWPSIPIVVMSGYETLQSAGLNLNAAFLSKPFTMEAVLAQVRDALERSAGSC